MLAEVWFRQGKEHKAMEFLVDCLNELKKRAAEVKVCEAARMEEAYSLHRATLLRLFPEVGEGRLRKAGLPASLR